jgi:hypothetical protein
MLSEWVGGYAGMRSFSPRTLGWYKQKVEGPLSTLRKIPVDRIDRATVRALHEELTRKSGPCGANGAMRVLKLLINDAARTHDLPPNPVNPRLSACSTPDATYLSDTCDGGRSGFSNRDPVAQPCQSACLVQLCHSGSPNRPHA